MTNLETVLSFAGLGLGLATMVAAQWRWQSNRQDESDRLSAQRDEKLHGRISGLSEDVRRNFVHKDVHDADLRTIRQALDEQNHQINEAWRRIHPGE